VVRFVAVFAAEPIPTRSTFVEEAGVFRPRTEEILHMDIIAATEFLARSSTTTSVGWIGYIIIGAIAGWLAGKIVKGGGSGLLMNIVIGIVGALIGGFLLSFLLDTAGGGWWFTLFTATLGSVILLWIVGKVRSRS
jgi:uncharacterized membrane protein YeaQ/YmgE (transglycosylase-associated protein family)